MKFYEHIAIGLLANAALLWLLSQNGLFRLSALLNPVFSASLFTAITLFSILPDIDSINSLASKTLRLALFLVALASLFEFAATRDAFALGKAVAALLVFGGHFLYAKTGRMHRQFPHTFVFGIIACVIAYAMTNSKSIFLVSFVSFALHLAADGNFFSALKHDLNHFRK